MANQGRASVYRHAAWELDLDRSELRGHGVSVPLGSRALEIVRILVQSAGHVVTKDELMARVWPGAVVGENALHVHISAIRKALGADKALLETASGRGYRLLGTWAAGPDTPTSGGPFDLRPPTPWVHRTNLPERTSDLVGRSAAIRQVRDLLSAYRIVTLTGAGGIGKTRLAIDAARAVSPGFDGPGFEGNVCLVDLARLSDPGLVAAKVARLLGLRLGADTASAAVVAGAIGGRKLLLVLDNCEHLIEAVACLVETVMRVCAGTTVLATSRELLRIAGECVYRVAPLDCPPADVLAPDEILRCASVRLFVARLQERRSDFVPSGASLPTIGAIGRRLDGIPLAIEFAAAQAAALGPEQVLARLDDMFGLLTAGHGAALPHHETLRATFDWSYRLLPEFERRLLRGLAVFVAGFTIDAAAAVMGVAAAEAGCVADGIASLVTKSLVLREDTAPIGRWRMLETTRACAWRYLADSHEMDTARQRHAAYFRDLFAPGARACLTTIGEPADGAWRHPMPYQTRTAHRDLTSDAVELANVRAALDWAFSATGDIQTGVVLTALYVPVWLHLSLIAECRERAGRALNRLERESGMDSRLRMTLTISLSVALLNTAGGSDRMALGLAQALEVAVSLDEVDSQLQAIWALWNYRFDIGEHRAAMPLAQRFLRLAHRTRDPHDLLVAHRLMGETMHYGGNQLQARGHLERVLERYAAPRDQRHLVWFYYDQRLIARAMLARVLCLQGHLDQARRHARESMAAAVATDHTLSLRYVLAWAICPVALMIGELDLARRSIVMLLDVVSRHGDSFWQNVGACLNGMLLIRAGDFAAGARLLGKSLETFGRIGCPSMCYDTDYVATLAEGLAGAGRLDEALDTIEQALARCDRDGVRWSTAELLRIKAELLLRPSHRQSADAAEACFTAALDEARRQGAALWEIRIALGLARLKARQDRPDEAHRMVAPVYERFTEGFDTADLRAARAFLDALPTG